MNVKPADLALCVDGCFTGATCVVVAPASEADIPQRILARYGPHWLVRFPRPMQWQINGSRGDENEVGAYPDAFLKRLSGPDIGIAILRADAAERKRNEHA